MCVCFCGGVLLLFCSCCFVLVFFFFFFFFPTFLTLVKHKKFHVLMNKMLLRMKKAVITVGSINLVAMEKN